MMQHRRDRRQDAYKEANEAFLKEKAQEEGMTGCVPIQQIVQTLVSEGYNGWLTVEQYGSRQMLADCRTAFDNVRKMLDESR